MNTKKTLLAVLLLIIACAFPAHASQDTNSAADFLIGFGVLSEKDVAEGDAPMTRGEFVKLAAKIGVPYTYDYSNEEPKFADVQKNSPIFNSVMLLTDLDVVNGVSPIEFAPDANISYHDASAVLVRILGYDFLASDSGYLVLANEIGILDGINPQDSTLTTEDAYKMLKNALFAEVKYGNRIDGFPDKFDSAPLMEKRFKIKEITGIVTDNGITGISESSTVGKNGIKIGNKAYVNKSGKKDLLGCNVKAYWKVTDLGDTIIYAYAPSGWNEIEVINSGDIKSFENSVYDVFTGKKTSKTKSYSLTDNYKVIYNGKPFVGGVDPSLLNDIMCPDNGTVKLISNNSDNKYDIVIIENYYTILVSGYQETTKTVFNEIDVPIPQNLLDPQQSISFDNIDVDVVSAQGTEMSLDTIAKNNVLSVMMSVDRSYAKVIISTENTSGKLDISKDNGRYVTIDGTEYETSKDIREYISLSGIGQKVTAYINHSGKVVFIKNIDTIDGTLAYLHRTYYDADTEKTGVNMFTVDKKVKKVKLAKNVTIDGDRYTSALDAYNYISSNPYAINNLVIVDFNENDEVIRMDTPYYDYEDPDGIIERRLPRANEDIKSLHIMKDKYQKTENPVSWVKSPGYVDEYTKIFVVPFNTKEAITNMGQIDISKINIEDINVTNSWNTAINDTSALHTRYTLDDDSLYTDAIIVYKNTTGKDMYVNADRTRSANYIVTDIRQAVNSNDSICYEIWYTDGTSNYRACTETLNGINSIYKDKNGDTISVQVGDVVKFAVDKNGIIPDNQLIIMYSPATDPDNLISENGSQTNLQYNSQDIGQWEFVLLKGQVDVMNDRVLRIIRTEYKNGNAIQVPIVLQRAKMQYIVYEDGKVDFADGSYIETRKDLGDAAGEVVFDWSESSIRFAYIVR